MPNQEVQEQIEKGKLLIAVDDTRAADDPHKLTTLLRTTEVARLADLRVKEFATYSTEATRAGASARIRTVLDELRALHLEGFNFIRGLLRSVISAPDRLALFISYGWESGEIGEFDDARIEAMANQAVAVTPTIANPAHRYPAPLLTSITEQRDIVNQNQPAAAGGTQAATDTRDEAIRLMEVATERVRHHYCAASDLRTKNPELARIGFQVQRDAGDAQPQPDPATPGNATYNAADQTLAVSAMPDHASFLRAYRKPQAARRKPPASPTPRPSLSSSSAPSPPASPTSSGSSASTAKARDRRVTT